MTKMTETVKYRFSRWHCCMRRWICTFVLFFASAWLRHEVSLQKDHIPKYVLNLCRFVGRLQLGCCSIRGTQLSGDFAARSIASTRTGIVAHSRCADNILLKSLTLLLCSMMAAMITVTRLGPHDCQHKKQNTRPAQLSMAQSDMQEGLQIRNKGRPGGASRQSSQGGRV